MLSGQETARLAQGWRAELGVRHPGVRGAVLRGINPLTVLASVDGSRLRATKPTASLHGEDLRKAMLESAPATHDQTVAA